MRWSLYWSMLAAVAVSAYAVDGEPQKDRAYSLSGHLRTEDQGLSGITVGLEAVASRCDQAGAGAVPAVQHERSVEVDADGAFRFKDLPAAVYRLSLCLEADRCFEVPPRPLVSSEDLGPVVLRYSSPSRRYARASGEPTTSAVRVRGAGGDPSPPGPTGPLLRGSVRDAVSGAPVGGAIVWTDDEPSCYATTGPQGAFALRAPEAEYRFLRAVAPRYLEAKARAVAGRSGTSEALRLTPAPAVLQGVVHSWMGGPLPGALIFLPGLNRWARSSEDGAFEITRLPHPAKVQAEITASGFEDAAVALPTALPSAPPGGAVVTLESAFRATGEVRDAANRPLEGVQIQVPGRWPQPRFVTTDAAGRFSVPIPRPGYFSLQVQKSGSPTVYVEVMVTSETPTPDLGVIRLGGALQIWGVVRTAEGEPLEGVEVFDTGYLGSADRDEASRRPQQEPVARTGEGGSFEYRVERGALRMIHLEFWKEGFVPAQHEIPLHEPDLPLLIFLDRGYELSAKVVDSAGSPVAGAIVQLSGGQPKFTRNGSSKWHETGPEGEFTIPGLESGSFRMVISRDGYAVKILEVREEPLQEDLEMRIVLDPEARIDGRVVDRTGRPVPGLAIGVLTSGEVMPISGHIGGTDPDGSFVLYSLPAGLNRIQLTKYLGAGSEPLQTYEDVVLFPGPQEIELVWAPPAVARRQ